MKIINQSDIYAFEAKKDNDKFSSAYLAAGYIIFIAFMCIVGGSLIQLAEALWYVFYNGFSVSATSQQTLKRHNGRTRASTAITITIGAKDDYK